MTATRTVPQLQAHLDQLIEARDAAKALGNNEWYVILKQTAALVLGDLTTARNQAARTEHADKGARVDGRTRPRMIDDPDTTADRAEAAAEEAADSPIVIRHLRVVK